ncbi:MAG: YlbF family regulator [Lactobacillus iners]|nr:YlbF family regulator [Lactobacillus iners]
MINIYDSVNELTANFEKTDEFVALRDAINAVKANENSLKLYHHMEEIRNKFIAEQEKGNSEMSQDELIKNMMVHETAVYQLLNDIQKSLTDPISNLYDALK